MRGVIKQPAYMSRLQRLVIDGSVLDFSRHALITHAVDDSLRVCSLLRHVRVAA